MDSPKHSATDRAILLLKEIEKLQSQTELMEASVKEAQTAAEGRLARMQEQYSHELSSLRTALDGVVESARAENAALRARIAELEAARRQTSEPAVSTLEQSLRKEIERLLHEAGEKNRILQNRNDELVRVKAELDKLQERLTHLESSNSRVQSAFVGDAERMQTEFQAQLALLQAELSQREWALEEKDAATRTVEQNYRREIESLRRQVAEHEPPVNFSRREPAFLEPRPSAPGQADPVQNLPHREQADLNRSRRRWLSGFGRKRRWHQ
jgi:hypothetical protein